MTDYIEAIRFLYEKCNNIDTKFSYVSDRWIVELALLDLGIIESCVGTTKQECAQKVAIQAAKNLGWTYSPWQPIETAPKDGTHIIAAYAKRNVFASRRIWANVVKWDCTYNGWVDDETEHFMSDKMYSHWMPLLPIDK